MVSTTHELFVQLFTRAPRALFALVPELEGDEAVTILSEDFTQSAPVAYRADAVLQLGAPPRALIVLEVQRRIDRQKARRWPLYLAAASARHELPATLVVVALSASAARWASGPFPLWNGAELRPIVLSPLSVIHAGTPELLRADPHVAVAVMACYDLARRTPSDSLGVLALDSLAERSAGLAEDELNFYTDVVLAAVSAKLRAEMEQTMNLQNWEPKTKFVRDMIAQRAAARREGLELGLEQGLEQGLERGLEQGARAERLATRRAALRTVLTARALSLSDDQDSLIQTCEEAATLDVWIQQAATAVSAEEALRLVR